MESYAYGYPRLGPNREFKAEVENFFAGKINEKQLSDALRQRQEHISRMYASKVNLYPAQEISPYDPFLDQACSIGWVNPVNFSQYYAFARGDKAFSLKKWFNTNYHYLAVLAKEGIAHTSGMPDFLAEAKAGGQNLAWILGPLTMAKLAKRSAGLSVIKILDELQSVYLQRCKGLKSIHLDEPALVMDLTAQERLCAYKIYEKLGRAVEVNLVTYYDDVDDLKPLFNLPIKSIGLDFISGSGNLSTIRKNGFPREKTLIAGVVNGRSVFRAQADKVNPIMEILRKKVSKLMISNAGPLYHLPETIENENFPERIKNKLSFAKEKLGEIAQIAMAGKLPENSKGGEESKTSPSDISRIVRSLSAKDFKKNVSYNKRAALHKKIFRLPVLPTTTIGSFPQTNEIRSMRLAFRKKEITGDKYREYIYGQIRQVIGEQEKLGLDVYVHGEPERTDMVEYFAEKLDGFQTTENGWVISYGTRVWRPPIIIGDIKRKASMTLDEISYAQSLTKKPLKGMLTGPVTIISWSFPREDILPKEIAYQLALALREEIRDYEKRGISIVQVDEPAIRERAPVKTKKWKEYFEWAVNAFNLATNTSEKTQIHIHMCYSDFSQIMSWLIKMDFDVITIEAARGGLDILEAFKNTKFNKQIGLGVWDIHSPRVPSVEEMKSFLKKAIEIFGIERCWANPDCGLKTRQWPETRASLQNMVQAVKQIRSEHNRG